MRSAPDVLIRLALLEAEAAHRRELIDDRFKAASTALEVALEAANKRLSVLNELRQVVTDQANLMARRTEVASAISAIESKVFADNKAIHDKLDVQSRPNYVVGISAITSILVAIGGLWTVTGLKIDNAISPVIVAQENFRATQIAQDRQIAGIDQQIRAVVELQQTNTAKIGLSTADREQLNARIRDAEALIAKHAANDQAEINELRVALTRVQSMLPK